MAGWDGRRRRGRRPTQPVPAGLHRVVSATVVAHPVPSSVRTPHAGRPHDNRPGRSNPDRAKNAPLRTSLPRTAPARAERRVSRPREAEPAGTSEDERGSARAGLLEGHRTGRVVAAGRDPRGSTIVDNRSLRIPRGSRPRQSAVVPCSGYPPRLACARGERIGTACRRDALGPVRVLGDARPARPDVMPGRGALASPGRRRGGGAGRRGSGRRALRRRSDGRPRA